MDERKLESFLLFGTLRLVETLRTASNNFEDYEFEDLAAAVKQYEPELALSFGEL